MQLSIGQIVNDKELDDAVHNLQVKALSSGMIPIAGILSKRIAQDQHKILGFGWNHLREGIPGVHGETGALMHMGRLSQGYKDLTVTSSLSPCPFCQCTLARHLGIREIRILDATNYKPDFTSYAAMGLMPTVKEHASIVKTFAEWVQNPEHQTIWNRDIGVWELSHPKPFDVVGNSKRTKEILSLAHNKAAEGKLMGEAPLGAVIVDALGEVIGVGYPRIKVSNDPTAVTAMSAWRACGARDHWKDKTLFLTCGPDPIAYSMFHIFKFGQLVVASSAVFAGLLQHVQALSVPVHECQDTQSDEALRRWIAESSSLQISEYLGVEFENVLRL